MKLLGIDPGQKYFGLAIADSEIQTSFPYKVLQLDDISDFIKELSDILDKEKIQKIIIGRPLNLSGQETKQTREIDKIIKSIKEKIKMPVVEFDERFTSKMAERLSFSNKKDHALSASIILQDYLNKTN